MENALPCNGTDQSYPHRVEDCFADCSDNGLICELGKGQVDASAPKKNDVPQN